MQLRQWKWTRGITCNYTSCDCNDENACNYANGLGQAGTCDYTECTCDDVNACNYPNADGKQGELCDYTECTCDDVNACNYPNADGQDGVTCNYTECTCDDDNACNYANANGKQGITCQYTSADGWCGQGCLLNQSFLSVSFAEMYVFPFMPGTIAVSLTHTHGADVPTVDYSAFDFQVRYQGGEWQNIIWLNDNPPAGLVDGTVTWTGVIPPISDQLHRCEVNLEFREFRDSNPGCVLTKGASDSESQGTLFPVSLSASGCNDPEACNFVSPCGTDESCVYAEDYWTVDGDGEYDQYQG